VALRARCVPLRHLERVHHCRGRACEPVDSAWDVPDSKLHAQRIGKAAAKQQRRQGRARGACLSEVEERAPTGSEGAGGDARTSSNCSAAGRNPPPAT
jgi:hypothetical protein